MAALTCDMRKNCEADVEMIDEKGFVYCTPHGLDRRGFGIYRILCRKLRTHELNKLKRGEPLARY